MTARDIRLDVLGINREQWIAEKDAESAAKLTIEGPASNGTPVADGDADPPPGLLERVDVLPSWRGQRKRPEAHVLERSDGARLFPAGIG